VVVDTPGQLSEVVLAAFDVSELLYIMATLDLPSIRNMGVFLTTLDRLKIPSDHVRLILNKAESDIGLDVGEVEQLFQQGFTARLPYAKEVHRSINMGTPVLASSPDAAISRAFAGGVSELLPPEQRDAFRVAVEHAAAPRPRLFQRLRRVAAAVPALEGAK
jgi:pilus assembly protein CpaE